MDRYLAAIVVVDVVGYSRMMSQDEADTLSRVFALREQVIDPAIEEGGGRVVKGTGDGVIAEFRSAVDAVRASIAVQRGVASWPVPGDPIQLRIGIHTGDVTESDGDVFGDTVNIAARLEGEAERGGVLISAEVRSQVAAHDLPEFAERGPLQLKNIERTIVGWAWPADEGSAPRRVSAVAGKPSIAVLPFTTASEDDRHIADGIVEDLTAMMSRFHWFQVIANSSARAAAHTSGDPQTLANALGCRYLVDGSVRRAGKRIRVHTQVIDAREATPVWADTMDRDFEDLFDLQDDIVRSIVGALVPQFVAYYSTSSHHQSGSSASAWENAMLGWNLVRRLDQTRASIARAREYFDEAKRQDPNLALAWAGSALSYANGFYRPELSRDIDRTRADAERALELDSTNAFAWSVLGSASLYANDLDGAERALQRALSINPSLSEALATMAVVAGFRLDLEGQRYWTQRLAEVSPQDPWLPAMPAAEATALFGLGRYEETLDVTTEAIRVAPEIPSLWRLRVAALEKLGRHAEASEGATEVMERFPGDPAWFQQNLTRFADETAWHGYLDALRSAGLDI